MSVLESLKRKAISFKEYVVEAPRLLEKKEEIKVAKDAKTDNKKETKQTKNPVEHYSGNVQVASVRAKNSRTQVIGNEDQDNFDGVTKTLSVVRDACLLANPIVWPLLVTGCGGSTEKAASNITGAKPAGTEQITGIDSYDDCYTRFQIGDAGININGYTYSPSTVSVPISIESITVLNNVTGESVTLDQTGYVEDRHASANLLSVKLPEGFFQETRMDITITVAYSADAGNISDQNNVYGTRLKVLASSQNNIDTATEVDRVEEVDDYFLGEKIIPSDLPIVRKYNLSHMDKNLAQPYLFFITDNSAINAKLSGYSGLQLLGKAGPCNEPETSGEKSSETTPGGGTVKIDVTDGSTQPVGPVLPSAPQHVLIGRVVSNEADIYFDRSTDATHYKIVLYEDATGSKVIKEYDPFVDTAPVVQQQLMFTINELDKIGDPKLDTTIYFKVSAGFNNGSIYEWGDPTEIFSFVRPTATTEEIVDGDETPAGGIVTPPLTEIYDINKDTNSAEIKWYQVSGANDYHVTCVKKNSGTIVYDEIMNTTSTIISGLEGDTYYKVNVCPRQSGSELGCVEREFKTKAATQPGGGATETKPFTIYSGDNTINITGTNQIAELNYSLNLSNISIPPFVGDNEDVTIVLRLNNNSITGKQGDLTSYTSSMVHLDNNGYVDYSAPLTVIKYNGQTVSGTLPYTITPTMTAGEIRSGGTKPFVLSVKDFPITGDYRLYIEAAADGI